MLNQVDNKWLAVDLIHGGEEEAALALTEHNVQPGRWFDPFYGVAFVFLEPLQTKFGRAIIFAIIISL